jgi:hypothetical protein
MWLLNLHVNVSVAATNGHWVVDVGGKQPRDNQDARLQA